MAELLGTDEFLVNRDDVTYTQEQETLMATLQDTDHLLVNRAGQTYKITGEDLINSVVDPLEVTVVLAPTDGYTDIEVTAVPVVSGGKQPDGGYIFTYQWVTADDAAGTNKANIAGATEATFTPDNPQVGKYLGCVVSTTDALGTTAEGEAYIGPIQVLAQPPVIADVVVSEIYDGQNRFTDKEFPYITTMAVDGEPNPTYEVKAKLSGTTFDFDVLSDVITDVEGGGIKTCETSLIQEVESVPGTQNLKLTFPDTQGFDCFSEGELIQEGNTPIDETVSKLDVTAWFDEKGITQLTGMKVTNILANTPEDLGYGATIRHEILIGDSEPTFTNIVESGTSYVSWTSYLAGTDGGYAQGESAEYSCSFDALDRPIGTYIQMGWKTEYGELVGNAYVQDQRGTWHRLNGVLDDVRITEINKDENTITVDGGEWRTSGEQPLWSSTEFCTSGAEGNGAYSSDRAFNGETAGEQIWYPPNGGPSAKFETGDLFNSAAQLTVMYGKAGSGQIILNGTNVTADWSNGTDVEKTVALSSGFQSLEFTYPSSGNYVSLAWIKIDGVLLQDGSAGDSKLVKETPYNAKLTLASNENFELLEGIETFMTDNSTPITQTPYKLTTTTIETAESSLPVMSIVPTYTGYAGLWEEESAGGFDSATSAGGYSEFSTNGPVTFTFNPPIPGSSIQYLKGGGPSSGSPVKYSINGGGEFGNFVTSSGWADPAIDLGLQNETISTITFEHNDSGTWGGFYVINFYSSDKSTYLPAKNNVLVFSGDVSTNPDLQYFLPGDLLQGGFTYDMGGGTATASFTPTNGTSPDVIMDGIVDNTNNRVLAAAGDMPGTVTCTPTNPVPAGAKISLVFALGNIPNSFTYSDAITLTAINGSPITPLRFDQVLESTLNFNSVFGVWKFPEGVNATSFTFQISDQIGGNNPVIWGFAVEEIPPVKVVSTDLASNTMVVSGGEWDASNQSQIWSDALNGNGGIDNDSQAFDGNDTTKASSKTAGDPTWIEWTAGISGSSEWRITGGQVSEDGSVIAELNGTETEQRVVTFNITAGKTYRITRNGSSSFRANIFYIKVDGRILIDAFNDSQIWSTNPININPSIGGGAEGAFNGIFNESGAICQDGTQSHGFEFNPPLENVSSFRIGCDPGVEKTITYTDKDNNVTTAVFTPELSNDYHLSDNTPDSPTSIKSVVIKNNDNSLSQTAGYEVNGEILINTGIRDLGEPNVTYETGGGQGNVIEVNTTDNTLLVTNSGDGDNRWIADNAAGTDFYVAPANPVPISQDYAWCKLQIINNMAQVTGIQKDDPGYLPVPSKDYTIKFPAVFPTGNEPDDDLPRGTCVAAIVAAENSEGRSVKESNCFMPLDVNPEGAAGPITDSTPTTLTVATNANLGEFSPGDNLVMVDENNDISNYTIVSDKIINVERNDAPQDWISMTTLNGTIYAGAGGIDKLFDGTSATCGPNQNSTVEFIPSTPIPIKKSLRFKGAKSNPSQGAIFEINGIQTAANWPASGSIVADANTWVTINNPPAELTQLKFGWTTAWIHISAIEIDDNILIQNQPLTTDVVLTCDSVQDLKFFRPGDVVQGIQWTFDNITEDNWIKPFDGTNDYPVQIGAGGYTWFLNGGSAQYSGNLEFWDYISGATGNIEIYGLDNKTLLETVNMPTDYGVWRVSSTPIENVGKVVYVGDYGWSRTKAGGVEILYTNFPTKAKVVDIDETVPSITVDGGNWDTSNQSEVWSNSVSGVTGGSVSNLFDGNLPELGSIPTLSDNAFGASALFQPTAFSDPNSVTSLTIYYSKNTGSSDTLTVDGSSITLVADDTVHTVDVAVTSFSNITWTHNGVEGVTLMGFVVNGKLLVDAANDSKVWSSFVTPENAIHPVYNAANLFNGVTGLSFSDGCTANEGSSLVWQPDSPITGVNTLEIGTYGNIAFNINGVSVTAPVGIGEAISIDKTTFFPDGVLTNIQWGYPDGSNYMYLTYIKVNGTLLVDTGTDRNLGDSEVTYGPVTGTGTFQVADQLNNTMTIQDSNDRWIDTSNRLGIDYYVRDNITVLNADNPKHVALQQAIADAFDAFPEKVNERRTAIASSFYRLMEGEALSTADYSLLEETVLTAVNASEPFALDGYYPLYYTSAKADAASSTDSHHSHTINGVTYYMPDSGTLYHGNYTS